MSLVSTLTRTRTTIADANTWVAVSIPVGAKDAFLSLDLSTATFRVTTDNSDTAASQGTFVAAAGGFLIEGIVLVAMTVYVSASAATVAVLIYTAVTPRYVLVPFVVSGTVDQPKPVDPENNVLRIESGTTVTLVTSALSQLNPSLIVGVWVDVLSAPTGTLTGSSLFVSGGVQNLLVAPIDLENQQGVAAMTSNPVITFPSYMNLTVAAVGAAGTFFVVNAYAMFKVYE